MQNNKILALLMLIAAAAVFIYKFVTGKTEKGEKKKADEEPGEAEIIPIGPRLAQRKPKFLDDEFFPLDDIDLMFLRICKDHDGTIQNYSFDFLRNHDTHYIVSCEDMDKIMKWFDETTKCEYTVDSLREYLADDGEAALRRLFDELEISFTFCEAQEDEQNGERTDKT